MENVALTVVAVCVATLLAGIVSRRIQGTIITLPMLFVAFGLALSPVGLDLVNLDRHSELVRVVAELTLVLVLASDASRIRVRTLLEFHSIPTRLLSIGLPLMMIVGTVGAAYLFDGLHFWGAAVLAVVLAPTDAGLGQAVVTNTNVPVRIRQALNIESGLNDGLAMPFLLLAMGLLAGSERVMGISDWVWYALISIVVGAAAGLAVGFLGGRIVAWGARSHWMTVGSQKLSGIVLAILAYSLAELLGGNGFVAAFCMGITAGNVRPEELTELVREFTDIEVEILMVLTFMIVFGATLLPAAIGSFDLTMLLYAGLSLAVIRPLVVAISLIGTKLHALTIGFLGWFGPRGIASILYIFIVMEEELAGIDTIYGTAMLAILISVYAHGITAAPAARWYGSRIAAKVDADVHERKEVPEMPLRYMAHRPR